MSENREHPDFSLIRNRWRDSIKDGSFNRWFNTMNPQVSLPILFLATGLLAATIVYFRKALTAAKIVLSEERAVLRRRDAYRSSVDSCDIRIAYRVPEPLFISFERNFAPYVREGVPYFRAIIPEDRVCSQYGWDSNAVEVFKAFYRRLDQASESGIFLEKLRKRGPLTEPMLIPSVLAGGRRIWAVDLQMDKTLGEVWPPTKSQVVPCIIPGGDFSKVLPLPQFLIADFQELDQEFRKRFNQGSIVFEEILRDPDCSDPVAHFVAYLRYESRSTFSREESIIFNVFEVESEIRGVGIESAIASLTCGPGPDHFVQLAAWADGLNAIGQVARHQSAKEIMSYLDDLKSKFAGEEEWHYDDIEFAVSSTFPPDIKRDQTEAFDVSLVLLDFALKNRHCLRRIAHPALASRASVLASQGPVLEL